MSNAQRLSLGVVALVVLAAGIYGALANLDPTWPGLLVRSGMVLGAVWFAAPALARVSRRWLIGFSIAAAVIIVRPRLVLFALVAGAIATIFAGRVRS